MRVIALIAAYNEERFIANCLEHLIGQGVEVYLLDNGSTDRTAAIAGRYLGKGLIAIEALPRDGTFRLRRILARKEQLAATLEADWFMHCDADEIRLPPRPGVTLAEAFAEVQAEGYNAVNFIEFTFVPTRESPDHDHADYMRTMRWYYPYSPAHPHRLNAWQRQPRPVELAWSAGHQVRFPGLRMWPEPFPMRHYLFLSVAHAARKFVHTRRDSSALRTGWSTWRSRLTSDMIKLPAQAEMRMYVSDECLDCSNPRTSHYLADAVTAHLARGPGAYRRLLGQLWRWRSK